MISMQVKRGEIYYATLDPVVGSETGKTRPVLIIHGQTDGLFPPYHAQAMYDGGARVIEVTMTTPGVLEAIEAIDCDHPQIRDLAYQVIHGARDVHEKARRLFDLVRDTIKYNPYSPFFLMEHYKATTTLRRGRGYCVQKSVMLIALAASNHVRRSHSRS